MKEGSKNGTIELINVREEIIKDINVEVARLKQQVIDKEGEMMQMEKYFKHAYYMLVLEACPLLGLYEHIYLLQNRSILKWKNYKILLIMN